MPALYGKDASHGGESPCGFGGTGDSYVMEVGRVKDSFVVSVVWHFRSLGAAFRNISPNLRVRFG